MQNLGISSGEKWSCSLYVVFLFVVISSPIAYKFTNKLFYKLCKIANASGAPTGCGLFLHAVLFLLLVRCTMCMKEGLDINKMKKTFKKKAVEPSADWLLETYKGRGSHGERRPDKRQGSHKGRGSHESFTPIKIYQ